MPRQDAPLKELFTIQDLENLSGIKAHTIRIWEKRYALLHPSRDANNIRYYSSQDLRKILNVSALIHYGYRISAIAGLSDEEINRLVNGEATGKEPLPQALRDLKLAMMTFDQGGFDRTYADLLKRFSFREVFADIFLPLLRDIGLMWQTGTIHVGHEHFISNLIKQKILLQIEHLGQVPRRPDGPVFLLFLPLNEVHELGLLYMHYALLAKGATSVYLGPSVPTDDLRTMTAHFPRIDFVTWMTVEPRDEDVAAYVDTIVRTVMREGQDRLWLLGRKCADLVPSSDWTDVHLISRPDDLLERIS
jgi:DNA-binding transcriptional MerR regulator